MPAEACKPAFHKYQVISYNMAAVFRIRIRCYFDPRIREGRKSGTGMNITDNFLESLETGFRVKNT
jgi:hypothetical protein